MCYGERALPAFTFHVSRHGANLLGLDLFHNLGFTLLDTTGSEIHTVAILWQQQWPALFEGLAFGLNSAPSCFQKNHGLHPGWDPWRGLDDIVVHGINAATHDEHHLMLNTDKCVFVASVINYVGFRLSAGGISPLQSNMEAIQCVPEPTSSVQVASFLGMTAYFLSFLPQYSDTTAPLRKLLKTDEPWIWTPACSEAVLRLKDCHKSWNTTTRPAPHL